VPQGFVRPSAAQPLPVYLRGGFLGEMETVLQEHELEPGMIDRGHRRGAAQALRSAAVVLRGRLARWVLRNGRRIKARGTPPSGARGYL
jgi:hypothetical protein